MTLNVDINKTNINIQSEPITTNNDQITILQNHARNYLQKVGVLSTPKTYIYKRYCEQLEDIETKELSERVLHGSIPTIIPKEYPEIIIKQAGNKCIFRKEQMKKVYDFIREKKVFSLVVPKAISFKNKIGNFLVEERLPINNSCYKNIDLYLSNLKLFDPVVKDMILFYQKYQLGDLVISTSLADRMQKTCLKGQVSKVVRWDNIPILISTKNGKNIAQLALIDLEELEENPDTEKSLCDLVSIFPHHYDLIISEAKRLKLQIDEESLKESKDEGLKYFKIIYEDHRDYINKKHSRKDKCFYHNDDCNLAFGKNVFHELEPFIEKELKNLNRGINETYTRRDIKNYLPKKSFLKGINKSKCRNLIAKRIIGCMLATLTLNMKDALNNREIDVSYSDLSEPEKIQIRRCIFKKSKMNEHLKILITEYIKKEKINSDDLKTTIDLTAEQLMHTVFNKLVDIGELFFYDDPNQPDEIAVIRF